MAKQKTSADVRTQITKVRNDIRQSENHVKQLLQKKNHMERKVRTRRLIERGAILESLITNASELSNEQIKTLLQSALSPVVIYSIINQNAETITGQGNELSQTTTSTANPTHETQMSDSHPTDETVQTQAQQGLPPCLPL